MFIHQRIVRKKMQYKKTSNQNVVCLRLSVQKCGNTAPQTVKIWNFGIFVSEIYRYIGRKSRLVLYLLLHNNPHPRGETLRILFYLCFFHKRARSLACYVVI